MSAFLYLNSLGTLALGINAPAKTCVFLGDSPYLTALMVRYQMCYRYRQLKFASSSDNVAVVLVDAVMIYLET